ncbi:MAG: O-antigen ligase family protein, partial [Phycisphaerae bacterium]
MPHMNPAAPDESDPIDPLHVVVIVLAVATIAAGFLVLSAAESPTPVDGAVAWHQESPLRAVVALLCLKYAWPTVYAGDVKNLALAVGAGLILVTLSIGLIAGRRNDSGSNAPATPPGNTDVGHGTPRPRTRALMRTQVTPLAAAQAMAVLYLLWSFASSRWSRAPDLALGGSILLTIQLLWAGVLGMGLRPAAATVVCRGMMVVTAVTAGVAVWYYYGRNPTLDAKFPFGNPIFLATCLTPGLLLTGTRAIEHGAGFRRTGGRRHVVGLACAVGAIALGLWAFLLTRHEPLTLGGIAIPVGKRGPTFGGVIGLLAVAFFAMRGRRRAVPAMLAVGLTVAGWFAIARQEQAASPRGGGATITCRRYAWSYALRLFEQQPWKGHGQAGFVLAGDALAVNDVERDPQALATRLAHAHNEWLEVMADLGSVGLVLLLAVLLLTLDAGMVAIDASPHASHRWALIGLMASLVALIVDACFDPGLRVSGVPTVFYGVLGLIWALARPGNTPAPRRSRLPRGMRIGAGAVG